MICRFCSQWNPDGELRCCFCNNKHADEADATLSYSLDAFLDSLDIIRFDGTESEGSDSRTTFSGTLNWYQVISPKTHGELGITIADQSGFLETPYNAVVLEDPREMELPDVGLVALEDPETGERTVVDTADARVRTAFQRQQSTARIERDRTLRSLDVDTVSVRTDVPYTKPLMRFFRERERRH